MLMGEIIGGVARQEKVTQTSVAEHRRRLNSATRRMERQAHDAGDRQPAEPEDRNKETRP